jgi:hypothetical protein
MKDFTQVSEIDWAKLAAYIDGEGCISIMKCNPAFNRQTWILSVTVSNTDPRLPQWIKDRVGGQFSSQAVGTRKATLPIFHWNVRNKQAELVLRNCLPHFVIKREQAEIAIAFRGTTTNTGRRPMDEAVVKVREEFKAQLTSLKKLEHLGTIG